MIERSLPAGPDHVVRVRCSERCDGDYAIHSDPEGLARARMWLAPGQWTWLQQVHGANVVVVDEPGAQSGASADASVTTCVDAVLSVQTADCAPLVLASESLVGLVHAGWQGIVKGLIGATFDLLRSLGGEEIHALLGPCIAPAGYEFGLAELDLVASVAGDSVRSTTTEGLPALDLRAAVLAQCGDAGVSSFSVVGPLNSVTPFDTAGDRWFSNRTRRRGTATDDGGVAGEAMTDAAAIARNLSLIHARLLAVNGENVRVVAVTKGHGVETIEAAIGAACTDIGESYAQESLHKNQALLEHCQNRPQVHFIGGLQSNKIRKLASIVDVWQSIDRFDLGEELARRPRARVLVQVDLSGEQTKRGCSPATAPELVERLDALDLNVIGLMGIGPIGAPEKARPGFALLRGLVDRLGLPECSMGMTADLEVAVQEGSTMVRIGTDLFGQRPLRKHGVDQ